MAPEAVLHVQEHTLHVILYIHLNTSTPFDGEESSLIRSEEAFLCLKGNKSPQTHNSRVIALPSNPTALILLISTTKLLLLLIFRVYNFGNSQITRRSSSLHKSPSIHQRIQFKSTVSLVLSPCHRFASTHTCKLGVKHGTNPRKEGFNL